MDTEEENVSVPASGRETDQLVAVEKGMNRRLPVGVGEKAPPLFEERLRVPYQFLQLPGILQVLLFPRLNRPPFQGNAHYELVSSHEL